MPPRQGLQLLSASATGILMTSSICGRITRHAPPRRFCTRRCPMKFPMRLAIRLGLLRPMLLLGALGWLGAAPAGAAGTFGTWQVVLAAGDDAEPVFDNATNEMNRRLAAAGIPPGNIHRLSASAPELAGGAEPATADLLLRR